MQTGEINGRIPGLDEQAKIIDQIKESRTQANVSPLPGPLADAFMPEPLLVRNISIRPMMPGDWIILRQLDSSLLKPKQNEDFVISDNELIELCFLFTRPAKQCRDVLKQGREKFFETALEEIGDKYPMEVLKNVFDAVGKQLNRAFSTALKYSTTEKDKDASFLEPA